MKKTGLTAKARNTTAIITAAAVITRPVRPMPIATASSFETPEVVLLLDARHHEHGVVGRQAEDHREQEHEARDLDRRRARCSRTAPSSQPSWKASTSDAERRRERQRVHQQRLDRQQHRAGEQEQQDERGGRDHRDHQRQRGRAGSASGR